MQRPIETTSAPLVYISTPQRAKVVSAVARKSTRRVTWNRLDETVRSARAGGASPSHEGIGNDGDEQDGTLHHLLDVRALAGERQAVEQAADDQ
jgi:hypothetical protein